MGTVFLLALFIISRIMNQGNTDMTMEMREATYPVVSISYGGHSINRLHGYAQDMNLSSMRESITPLSVGRRIDLNIESYGRGIKQLSFEVRSVDGERLVENTNIEEYEYSKKGIEASFVLKDLIEDNHEYMLTLFVTLDDGSLIRYYTRVVSPDGYYVGEKLDYVRDFSNRTFNKEAAKELTKYLESNSEGNNTTFGRVTIHSSFNQVTWGELQIERETEPQITIKELATQTGSFLVEYYASVREGTGRNYYKIREYYRIRYTPERIYLLDFERTMDQVFVEKGNVYSNNKIILGIASQEVPLVESDGGNVIAFITGNRLYSYNVVDNKIALLFGFYDEDNSDDRTLYEGHKLKILNVDEAGNVTFMVYGYMNRGRHEGQVGISVYFYDSMVNTVEEMVYIESNESQEILMAEVAELCYLNKNGVLYLMRGNQIYGISAVSRTSQIVVQDLAEGGYRVSPSNRMVVWEKGSSRYGSRELILMNLNTGDQKSIQAGRNEIISPLGFIGEDLIYGVAKESDIVTDYAGNIILPMYMVRIENEAEGVKKTYRQENVYITQGRVSDNQIILTRVEKTEEGAYAELSEDQIMNAETTNASRNTVETVVTATYETLTQIALRSQVDTTSLMHLTPREVIFEGGRSLVLEDVSTITKHYYVYGKYGIEGIFMNEGNAVNLAYDIAGVVIDNQGAYVWMRGNRSIRNQIMAIQGEELTEERSALAICLDTMLAYEGIVRNSQYMLAQGESAYSILEEGLEDAQVLDLTGCPLDAVLYYVNQDIPVLVTMQDESAVLLVGFNEQNTVIMNPENGEVYKMGMNDSREWFEQNGNSFLTYIRSEG